MKVWKIVLIVSLCLALVFGVVLIVLSVKREYAKLHYRNSMREVNIKWAFGCGEKDCHYCTGQTVTHSKRLTHKFYSNDRYVQIYYEFIYFRTIHAFWLASFILTGISLLTATVAGVFVIRKRKKAE